MRIPIAWLSEIVTLPKSQKDLTDKLTLVGHMLDKVEKVDGETVLDLELRGNRADCYSIVGIAREVSAIFGNKIKKLPTVETSVIDNLSAVSINVKTPLVKRVSAIEITNVNIVTSPSWLAKKLKSYGMESVNNIVDLTNYVMIETGEPMHAFDLDKVKGALEIRLAKDGEKIMTFTGDSITLTSDDLVWAKGAEILSVAGAVGEKNHSISPSTKNILLEAANYERSNIRRTVYRHNLLTDAGIRHEKELDPNMVEGAVGRFLFLLEKNKWGKFSPAVFDYYPKKVTPVKIKLEYAYVESLGGISIDRKEIKDILSRLNFKTTKDSKHEIEVSVPTYRTDIVSAEDLVEEVVRIFGYDKIPVNTLSLEIPENITPSFIKQEDALRLKAISLGFDETITSAFVKEKYLKLNAHPQSIGYTSVKVTNPPSPDSEVLRQTLLPNLFEIAKRIINNRGEETRLFETGKAYHKFQGKYIEERKIGFAYFNSSPKSFEHFKGLIDAFWKSMGITHVIYISEANNLPISHSYNIEVSGKEVGFGGMTEDIYYLEVDLDKILGLEGKYKVSLWPKYPPQIEDLTLTFPEKTHIGDVVDYVKGIDKVISGFELRDIYKDSYTFRIWFQDPKKTLTDSEVSVLRTKILEGIKSKFGGTLKA